MGCLSSKTGTADTAGADSGKVNSRYRSDHVATSSSKESDDGRAVTPPKRMADNAWVMDEGDDDQGGLVTSTALSSSSYSPSGSYEGGVLKKKTSLVASPSMKRRLESKGSAVRINSPTNRSKEAALHPSTAADDVQLFDGSDDSDEDQSPVKKPSPKAGGMRRTQSKLASLVGRPQGDVEEEDL